MRSRLVSIAGIALIAACRTATPEPSLEEECGRAFERRIALESVAFDRFATQREQARILERTRPYVVEQCVARADIDAARCAARAESLRAVALCVASPASSASTTLPEVL
jgi:hypothetical protein